MKKIIQFALIVFLFTGGTFAKAQTSAFNGFCYQGGTQSLTSGLPSSNYLLGIIPNCTVSVYITGTLTLATIYKDGSNTPLTNPFLASKIGPTGAGQWLFYAANGQTYDVVMSGGNKPNLYPNTLTLTGLNSGGGNSGPEVNSIDTTTRAVTITGSDAIGSVTPEIDIRACGAVIDGATPIDAAIACSIAKCPSGSGIGGNSCTILLPCGGLGCYWANPASITWPSTAIKFKVQGTLTFGSTFTGPPGAFDMEADSGFSGSQFQMGSGFSSIVGPTVYGTLGTAISSTDTPVTFTPAFSAGTIANLPVNAAISVIDNIACTGNVVRTGASTNNVTATLSGACRIPQGYRVVAAGCSNSALNGNFLVTGSDYPAQTLGWTQSGGSASATGCTITGPNEDTFETARITAASGSVLTATFAHTHSSSALWGEVVIAPPLNHYGNFSTNGVTVSNCYGACFWGEVGAYYQFEHSSFNEVNYPTSIPMEMDASWWFSLHNSAMLVSSFSGSPQNGYPYSLRCSELTPSIQTSRQQSSCAYAQIDHNSVIEGGVKIDSNGQTGLFISPPTIQDTVIEQPTANALTIDNRNVGGIWLTAPFKNVYLQDDFNNFNLAWIGYTDAGSGNGSINIENISTVLTASLGNKYFTGRVIVNGTENDEGTLVLPIDRGVPVGTILNGFDNISEIGGIGSGLGPSVIPYATQTVTTNPASWSCGGPGCSVTTGVLAPDGSTGAGTLTSGTNYSDIGVAGFNTGTTAGDWFIFGGWMFGNGADGRGAFQLVTQGSTDAFAYAQAFSPCGSHPCATSAAFQPDVSVANLWWHPIVAAAKLATGTVSSHSIQLFMDANAAAGSAVSFWQPFLIYIPASAGVSDTEVERWRQELMHGTVPSNFNMPGVAATSLPVYSPGYFGLSTAPTGSCPTNGEWSFSQDNVIEYCSATWHVFGGSFPTNILVSQFTSGSSGNYQIVGVNGSLGTAIGLSAGQATTADFYVTPSTGYLNVPTGIEVAGTPLKTTNLGDWTNSGATEDYVATCTFVVGGSCTQWTPEAAPSGSFTALSGDANSTSTGGATEVTGILNHALPSLTSGFLQWTGSALAWGTSTGPTIQTNGVNNTSQTAVNFITSTVNSAGLTVTPSNPTTSSEKFEVSGTYSGSISSGQVTTALGYTPANCTPGTTGSDCLVLTSGLVPVANLPQATGSTFGTMEGVTTTAGQVGVGTTTSGKLNFVDYLSPYTYASANCVSGSPASAWNTILTAQCRAGTYNVGGNLPFTDTSTAQFQVFIPSDWDSASALNAVRLHFTTGANTSGTIIFQLQISCYSESNAQTDDQAFATAQVFSTITAANANYANSVSLALNSTSLTGCTAPGGMLVKVTRNTDSAASPVPVTGATITLARKLATSPL